MALEPIVYESVNLRAVTASNGPASTPQQKLKYLLEDKERLAHNNGDWNYETAQQLAGLLGNPNRNPERGAPLANSQGVNDQYEALRDFLAIYSTTRADNQSGNGSWDKFDRQRSGRGNNRRETTHSQRLVRRRYAKYGPY